MTTATNPHSTAKLAAPIAIRVGHPVARSLTALNFLRQQGFKYLKSVKGGISAWSDEIDSAVPKY